MNKPSSRRRRWWRWALVTGGSVALAFVLSLPLWLPWAARRALKVAGVQTEQVNRRGWLGLSLSKLSYRFEGGEVRVEGCQVEAVDKLARFFLNPKTPVAPTLVVVDGWELMLTTGSDEPVDAAGPPLSSGGILDQVDDVVSLLRRWLPPTTLREGQVRAEGLQLSIREARWRAGVLELDVAVADRPTQARIRFEAPDRAAWRLSVAGEAPQLEFEIGGSRSTAAWNLSADGQVEACRWEVQAELPSTALGPWPTQVSVTLPDLLPIAGGLSGAGLNQLEARLAGSGDGTGLDFSLRAAGRHGSRALAELEVEVSGQLRQERFDVQVARFGAPLLSLGLQSPVGGRWAQGIGELQTEWRLDAKLAEQEWVPVVGEVGGSLGLSLSGEGRVNVNAALVSSNMVAWGRELERVELQAQANPSGVEEGEARVRTKDGSVLQLELNDLDVSRGTLAGLVARADLGPELIEATTGLAVSGATLSFEGAGQLSELKHTGALDLREMQLKGLRTSSLELGWDGSGMRQVGLKGRWAAGEGWVDLEAGLSDLKRVRVSRMTVGGVGDEPLTLAEPVEISWAQAESRPGAGLGFTASLSPLALTNASQKLAVRFDAHYPTRGDLALEVREMDSRWITAFASVDVPSIRLQSLEANAAWNEGPLQYAAVTVGALELPGLGTTRVALDIAGDDQALHVNRLECSEADRSWAQVQGELPVAIRLPGSGPICEILGDRGMSLTAVVEPSSVLDGWLRDHAHVHLLRARSEIELQGTPWAPSGRMRVRVDAVEPVAEGPAEENRPTLGAVELDVSLEPERVHLKSLRLQVAGQPLHGEAELPFPAGFWSALPTGEVRLEFSRLQGRVTVLDFPVRSVGAQWLGPMRPEGLLSGEVRLQPGWQLEGELGLDGLSTRAFPLLGPIRDIQGRIAFQDQQATITGMEADWGGATVQLSGLVDTAVCWQQPGAYPTFDVKVIGSNLPLARQAGLIVRSDLALHFIRRPGESPLLQGEVDLQRSFVLSDLDAVLGTTVRQASLPPPYFSVTQEPMASWRLDLTVRADRCIHVKSPFYRGIHSVNTRLSGTLRNPLLTGDVQVNEGRALFPYAAIPVRQGILTFTEQNPEAPRLVVLGASRTFGYDIRMDVNGSLNEPQIQFSSVPALTSEEIVMMITAGELPRNELNTTTQDRVAKLATLIGKDILNKLGSQDAGEERLILRTGEGISTGGRVTYYLEYRLTDQWGLVGEYDEYDAINAGVKWRIIQR